MAWKQILVGHAWMLPRGTWQVLILHLVAVRFSMRDVDIAPTVAPPRRLAGSHAPHRNFS